MAKNDRLKRFALGVILLCVWVLAYWQINTILEPYTGHWMHIVTLPLGCFVGFMIPDVADAFFNRKDNDKLVREYARTSLWQTLKMLQVHCDNIRDHHKTDELTFVMENELGRYDVVVNHKAKPQGKVVKFPKRQ